MLLSVLNEDIDSIKDNFGYCECRSYYGYWIPEVFPISQVHVSATLLLLTVGNQKAKSWDGLQWCNIVSDIIKIHLAILELKIVG